MRTTAIVLAGLFVHLFTQSQPSAQWRGPDRDGHYPGQGLLKEWPATGPLQVWSCAGIGKGYSSAVSDGKTVYVTGMKDSTDYLTAIDRTGKILWQVPFGLSWNGPFPEARCTPAVENGSVYVVSGLGTIGSYDAATGKTNWSFNASEKFGGVCGDWGVCESLLLVGDKVIFTPAGERTTMVALDKASGKTVWESSSLHDTSAYVSPRLIVHNGKGIIVTIVSNNLVGVDPENGKILWTYIYSALEPEESLKVWPGAPKTNTITPLYKDGYLYITGGYDHPGAMFRLADDGGSISLQWTDKTLDCHHGGVVLVDGYIYGSNWLDNSHGNWCCIDWKSGKPKYEQKWQTKGSIIASDGMLYLYDEKNGNVGLVRPVSEKFDLVSSFKPAEGKGPCWAHPSLDNGILLVRRGEVVMAFDVRGSGR